MSRCNLVVLALLLMPLSASAGNVFNSSNHSAEYIRTLNRNASTGVDAAVYNAAGTVALSEGFHLGLTNQFVFKKDNPSLGGNEFISDNPVLFYPTFSAVYASDVWSMFLHVGVPSGGGSKDFAEGHPVLSAEAVVPFVNAEGEATLGPGNPLATVEGTEVVSGNVVGSSVFGAVTLGGAYQIIDELSFGLGLRMVQGKESTTADGEFNLALTEMGQGVVQMGMLANPLLLGVNTETEAFGINPLVSLYYTPTEDIGIALQYQFATPMNWERTYGELADGVRDVGTSFYPAAEYQKDIPAVGTFGLSYQFTPELRAETNFTYYFNTQATWSYDLTAEDGTVTTVDAMAPYEDGYETGIGIEYEMGDLTLSTGVNYQKTGSTLESKTWLSGNLDTFAVGGGATYAINDTFDFTFGAFNVTYFSQTKNLGTEEEPANLTYSQSVLGLATGINAHF